MESEGGAWPGAAQERHLFHLWYQPFNIATSPERLIRGLENIFSEVSRYREASLMDNMKMGELANNLQLQKQQMVKER